MTHRLLPLAALPLLLAGTAAHAQAQGTEKVNQVTVYDEKDCPQEQADTITSCIVVTGESPYRVPSSLRPTPPAVAAAVEARRTITPVSGFGSCSASGVASYATCSAQEYEAWKKQQGTGVGSTYAELIDRERRARLGLIDTEAADQQAIVDAEQGVQSGTLVVDQAPSTGVSPTAGENATLPAPNEASGTEVTQPVPPQR